MDEKQQKILTALMSHFTIQEAARSLSISPNTIYLALKDEEFAKAYKEARNKSVEHSVTMLSKASSLAVSKLIEILQNKEEKSPVTINAARTVLEFAYKRYDVEQLVYRVEELEKAIKNKGKEEDDD